MNQTREKISKFRLFLIVRLERQAKRDQSAVEQNRAEIKKMKAKLDEDQHQLTIATGKAAEFKANKEQHETRQRELEEKAAAAKEEAGWKTSEGVSREQPAMDALLKSGQNAVLAAEGEAQGAAREADARLEAQTTEVAKNEAEATHAESALKAQQQKLVETKKEVARVRGRLREAQRATEEVEGLAEDIKSKEAKLEEVKASVNLTKLRVEVMGNKKKVLELERKTKSLREERVAADADRLATAELRAQEFNLKANKARLEEKKKALADPLHRVLGGAPPSDPASARESLGMERDRVARRLADVGEELASIKSNLKTAKQTMDDQSQQREKKDGRVREFDDGVAALLAECDEGDVGDDLSDVARRAKENVELLREELARKEATQHTYQQFVEELSKSLSGGSEPACPTCNRAFNDAVEARELKSELQDIVRSIPGRVRGLRSQLKRAEERRERLSEAAGRGEQFEVLRKEAAKCGELVEKAEKVGMINWIEL